MVWIFTDSKIVVSIGSSSTETGAIQGEVQMVTGIFSKEDVREENPDLTSSARRSEVDGERVGIILFSSL
jgi:hypothetical protein